MNAALNHVSVLALDIDESAAFYTDVLGMERVPTPNFEVPVQWLQTESGQLHLFERDMEPVGSYHFGVTVDDFEEVYRRAKAEGFLANWDDGTDASLYGLPDGAVQLYLTDPTGNLVEVDYPNVDDLADDIVEDVLDREEVQPQTGEAKNAALDLAPMAEDTAE
ncbi:VOC family protein [Natrinema ejinorense]|uniref:Glyoxalase n=1 Tax=Natrinema ejinorense TaxID=373386 RepID=A0A2A5QPZ6_9EURY|nr:VOC family protein [Natrinema ejinorense]PCR88869.1 glyoxalase [Natrinema ejinorense]